MSTQPPLSGDIDILYEEGPCLVVNKPPGLLTQAPPGIDSLEQRIKQFLIVRENKPGRAYLGIPHRLDRPASGAMVFAKHVRACRRLAEQFEYRLVEKTYWAVLAGEFPAPEGSWRDRMRKVPGQASAECVDAGHPDAKLAILHYRVLDSWSPPGKASVTLVEIHLETGRTHQIRLQAASRGHPIVGDTQYGSPLAFGEQHSDPRLRAIALHARQLCFEHPMTRMPVEVVAPFPACWKDFDRRVPGLPA